MNFKNLPKVSLIVNLVTALFIQSTTVGAQDLQESRSQNGWSYRLNDQTQVEQKYIGHQSGPDALKEDEGMHPLAITAIVVGGVAVVAVITTVIIASSFKGIADDPS